MRKKALPGVKGFTPGRACVLWRSVGGGVCLGRAANDRPYGVKSNSAVTGVEKAVWEVWSGISWTSSKG